MRRLLSAGVSANASDGASSDNKVLHWAASYGSAETVKLLCGMELILWCVVKVTCIFRYKNGKNHLVSETVEKRNS